MSWKIACGISIRVARNVRAVKNDDNPTLIRNTMANTPKRLSALKLLPVVIPNANATSITMAAWKRARTLAANTLERIITDLETGVLRTLFMKPKRLSQTTDIPTKAVVNTTVNATMLIAINEK